MSQPKLLRNNVKQVSVLAAIAILGTIIILSAFFLVSDFASNSYATSVNSEVTAEIDGTHYVTLSAPDVTFSISPTDSAQLSKQNINVSVETNAPGGADLYLSMANSTNALHLNGDTTSTAPAIKATASSVAANSLAANTWGYSTDDQTYSAVPTTASDPALLANVDGETTGTTSGSVISASIPVYYAANVDTSIPAGSYSNRMAYSAVVDGGIITEATLTKIEIDGAEVDTMQPEVENTLEVTTNLMTNTYGTPRVYLETTDPSGYQECGGVVVSRNESGYMTITCKVTPTQAATGVTLHIVPKGSSDDHFCTDGTYTPDTSDCEAGDWKWGSLVVEAPDIVEVKTLTDITYMQEMTPEICKASSENETKRLIDSRDGKYYWVAKLKDENCWMTQNLELDLSGRTLTPTDSDVSSSWAYSGSWYTAGNQGVRTNPAVQAWDLGDYVWRDLSNTGYCQSTSNLGHSSCSSGWQSISGMTAMTEPRTDGVTVSGDTYDAHYLVGNYYSWEAATAGTAPSSFGVASGSVCPAGWQLPADGGNGSYGNLTSSYNIGSNTAGAAAMVSAPLYFVYAGYVYPEYYLSGGSTGRYWAGWAGSSNLAAALQFFSSYVSTSTDYSRSYGISVRCVAGWE